MGDQFEHLVIPLNGKSGTQERLRPDLRLQIVDAPSAGHGLARRLRDIRQIIKEHQPNLLLTYNWGAIEWALGNLYPICPHLHVEDGFGVEEANGQLKRRVWTRRLTLSKKTHLLVPSQTLQSIARAQWHMAEQRLHFIPNGIDTGKFARAPDQSLLDSLGLPNDRPIIGTIAALRKEKNLARLIRAFAQVRNALPVHLLIIGDGTERQALETLSASLGLQSDVTFAGHIAEPETILGALDVFAISSDTEQMPYSVLEAMATGLPVAGIDAGDIKNLVAESNKSLIVDKSDGSLADVVLKLARDKHLCHIIGKDNKVRASEHYDQNEMIEGHRQLWIELCSRP